MCLCLILTCVNTFKYIIIFTNRCVSAKFTEYRCLLLNISVHYNSCVLCVTQTNQCTKKIFHLIAQAQTALRK